MLLAEDAGESQRGPDQNEQSADRVAGTGQKVATDGLLDAVAGKRGSQQRERGRQPQCKPLRGSGPVLGAHPCRRR